MEVLVMAAWHLWKERNGKIFDNVTPSIGSRLLLFKKDIFLRYFRLKEEFDAPLEAWLD